MELFYYPNPMYQMSQQTADKGAEIAINQVASMYRLKPHILKGVFLMRDMGYTNFQISAELSISKNTVSKYLDILRKMDPSDKLKLLVACSLIAGGLYILYEIFQQSK